MAFDYQEFKNFSDQFQRMAAGWDGFCRGVSQQIAAEMLRKCIKRTPVGKSVTKADQTAARKANQNIPTLHHGGTLRRGWVASRVIKIGDTYTVSVSNNVLYAAYVEYGHRQEPGRYVPAIGKRLKASWVPGRFMMTLSANEVERGLENKIDRALKKYMGQMLNG